MSTSRVCDWCNTTNDIMPFARNWCKECGHAADLTRIHCDCTACNNVRVVGVLDDAARVEPSTATVSPLQTALIAAEACLEESKAECITLAIELTRVTQRECAARNKCHLFACAVDNLKKMIALVKG